MGLLMLDINTTADNGFDKINPDKDFKVVQG